MLKDDADETNACMCTASVSAGLGLYGTVSLVGWTTIGLLAASESSPSGSVINEGVAVSADGAEVGDVPFVALGAARRPVVCIIEPSLRESIKVDCTPGRDVR